PLTWPPHRRPGPAAPIFPIAQPSAHRCVRLIERRLVGEARDGSWSLPSQAGAVGWRDRLTRLVLRDLACCGAADGTDPGRFRKLRAVIRAGVGRGHLEAGRGRGTSADKPSTNSGLAD